MLFITILSYLMLLIFSIRILAIIFCERRVQEEMMIKEAERRGVNLIFDSIKVPIIVVTVCLAWIISTFF